MAENWTCPKCASLNHPKRDKCWQCGYARTEKASLSSTTRRDHNDQEVKTQNDEGRINEGKKKSFWETLPGILTGIAAVTTAVVGCITVFVSTPWLVNFILPASPTPTALASVPMSPTNTPVPSILAPTDTAVPPAPTLTLSNTAVPPTPTSTPTLTDTPTPTPTHTPTNTPTNTPTYTPTPVRNSSILLFVYWDRDNDGLHDSSDFLLSAVLELYAGSSCSGTVIATPVAFLGYKFVDLPAGIYCVKVINNSVEDVGTCALIPRNNRNEKVYSLRANQDLEDLEQGFPYVCQ